MTRKEILLKYAKYDAIRRHITYYDEKDILEIATFINRSDFFDKKYKNVFCSNIKLEELLYDDALLLPLITTNIQLASSSKTFEHLAYDKRLNPIYEASFFRGMYRGFHDHPSLPTYPYKNIKEIEYKKGEYFYVGLFESHYGHFILETLSRLWSLNPKKYYDGYVLHVKPNEDKDIIYSSYYSQYLESLGISKEKIIIVDKPMSFEKIHIAQSSCIVPPRDCFISSKIKQSSININKIMSGNYNGKYVDQSFKKIYISRRSIKNPIAERKIINEEKIESLFKSYGYFIMHPELLESEYEKHYLLHNAEFVAGAPGSGLLNAIFAPKGVKVLCIESSIPANMALAVNIQVHYSCDDKCYVYFSDLINDNTNEWKVNIENLKEHIEKLEFY